MDIVVRTPHGDADISILGHDASTTLGDVVGAVTGQSVPRLARVDDRTVDCATQLDQAGLLVGSIVTTDPAIAEPASSAEVHIVQIAGHGAGSRTRLGPGRYRVGPGRRVHSDELAFGPVERAEIDVVVESTAAGLRTTVVPVGADVELAGDLLSAPTPWTTEIVTVGARAFCLESPATPDLRPANGLPSVADDPGPRPDHDGIIPFSRSPRRRDASPRCPVVDAVRDATRRASTLWERRPDHADAFSLTFGVRNDTSGAGVLEPAFVAVELAEGGGVAVVGSERFRSALVRSLIIDAVTLHGPADLDLVVLTSPDRIAEWEWAKWLPHLRHGGRAAIWSSSHDIVRWAQDPTHRSHLTFAVLDDPSLWTRRDSPLSALVTRPPGSLRLIAVCGQATDAPAVCTSMISETAPGFGRLQSFTSDPDVDDIRVALTETNTAARVARALAPLDDIEVPTSAPADERRDDRPVDIPSTDDVTVIVGSRLTDAFDVAATSILAQCAERSPDELWIAPLGLAESNRSVLFWSLPHATDPHDGTTSIDARRLLARVRAVLADARGPDRILIVLEERRLAASSLDRALFEALAEGARAIAGLCVLLITDRPRSSGDVPVADTTIVVDRGHISGDHRRTPAGLELRSAAIGRPLTVLERRIEQRADDESVPDPSFGKIIERLRREQTEQPALADPLRRTVVPTPLPTHIDLETLLIDTPGDGVPLGLVDDPATGGLMPRWWTPGDGSVLAVGSRRSGIEQVLSTVMLGLVDRFSPDDVRLVVIEPSATRRRALLDGDPAPMVRAPDRADEIEQTIDEIHAAIDAERQRRSGVGSPPDDPRLVVVIADLAQLRGPKTDGALVEQLDAALAAAGPEASGVDVIAYAGDLAGAGPFAAHAANRVAGASSAPADLTALGVLDGDELEGIIGRCRWFPGDDLVQLAMPDAVVETLLARRSSGGAS